MPKGIYKRTKQMRENISRGKRGITTWNKGITKYQGLLHRINWLLLLGHPQTLSQIYDHVSNEISYKNLQWLLSKARANGVICQDLIAEGRGLMKNKGGGLSPKFKVGDKVRIDRANRRTPEWLRAELRIDSPRKIVTAVRTEQRGYLYYLGSNNSGSILIRHAFRPCELIPYVKNNVGRPRTRRAYNRKQDAEGVYLLTDTNKGVLVDLGRALSISCVN